MNLLFFLAYLFARSPEVSRIRTFSGVHHILRTYNNTPSTCSYTSKAFYHSRGIRTLPSAGESTCTLSFTHTHAHPRPGQMHAWCIGRTRAAMWGVGMAVRGACITWCRILPSIRPCTLFTHCLYSCLHTCVQHHSTQEHVVSCAIPCMHCGRSVHYVVFEPFHSYTHHVCTLRIPLPFTHGHTVCRTGPYLAMKGCLRYVVFRSPSFTRTQTHAHTLYTLLCHQASSPHPMLCVLCSHTQAL